MTYLLIFFLSLIISIFITPYFIDYLYKNNILDKPVEKRKIHTTPIPRLGGVIIASVVLLIVFNFYPDLNNIRVFLYSFLIIFFLGLVDDIIDVRWNIKFLAQGIAALLFLFFLSDFYESIKIFGIYFHSPFSEIILFFFIVGIINGFNLLDGLDGLVAGYSLFIVTTLFFLTVISSNLLVLIICASLMGALIGMLKFNAHPARIFLGDSGALGLGFLTVACALLFLGKHNEPSIDLTFAIILFTIPIVDTLKVMINRTIARQNPFLPDRSHVHHLILSNHFSHKSTVVIVLLIAFLTSIASLLYIKVSEFYGLVGFAFASSFILNIKTILSYLNKFDIRHDVKTKFSFLSIELVSIINKYLYFAILILIVVTFFLIFPSERSLDKKILYLFLGFLVAGLLHVITTSLRKKNYNFILIFFNLIVFYTIAIKSPQVIDNIDLFAPIKPLLQLAFTLIVISYITLYFIFRERIQGKTSSLLSGMDLSIIAFSNLIVFTSILLQFDWMINIGNALFFTSLTYIITKIFVVIHEKGQNFFYYSTFVLSMFTLIVQIIY